MLTTVYKSFSLTLNAISRSFKLKSQKSSHFIDFLCTNVVSFMQVLINPDTCMNHFHEQV